MFLTELLSFLKFTHSFQQIKRVIYTNGEDRNENDSEHSYQLAMICWFIIQTKELKLDTDKIIKYALVHDLVEIYAGDTYFYSTDKNLQNSKQAREKTAFERIKKEFPKLKEIHKAIKGYEALKDEESKLVYAMDKMIPVLNIYLDKGRSWKRDKVTYEMARTKDDKIALSPPIFEEWIELIKILEKKSNLFLSSKIKKGTILLSIDLF